MTSIPVASPPVGVSVVPSAYDPLIAAAVVANGEGPSAGVLLAGAVSSQGILSKVMHIRLVHL